LIIPVGAVLRKLPRCVLGSICQAGMFVFTGHRTVMDNLLNSEYE
jgi:hypothetical protein